MYTQEQLLEMSTIINDMVTLTTILNAEGKIPSADRLITAGNITKINDNIGDFSDYLATLVPPAT